MNQPSLTLVVHGESGAGKSWLADTAPGPRLILDVEGGVDWTPSTKVEWDPRGPVPELGADDTAVVRVPDIEVIDRTLQWLASGQHPFRSIVIDSLSEAQKRLLDKIAGASQPTQQQFGSLLREGDRLVRFLRDLKMHQTKPAQVVVFVCGSKERGTEGHAVVRPLLTGQLADQLPYAVDVVMYLAAGLDEEGRLYRKGLFQPLSGFAAKDRTGKLGVTMVEPTIPKMLDAIGGSQEGSE